MRRALNILFKLQEVLGVLLFAGLTLVVTIQIVSRFVFHAPVIWSEEVARFLFFWVALTGAAMSVRLRRHFVIDVVQMSAASDTERALRFFDKVSSVIAQALILGFALLLLKLGWSYTALGTFRTGTNSEINMALVYAAIPFAAGTMAIYALANLYDLLSGAPEGGAPTASGGN